MGPTGTARRMRPSLRGTAPSLRFEQELWGSGHEVVVGLDEVGRGSWAGPLTVAAVVLPRQRRVNGVRDSKALTPSEREALFDRVAGWCSAWAIGEASAADCDELGMSGAQRLAARRAMEGLGVAADWVLVDGRWNFVDGVPGTCIVKGDATCLSIAAASILAKVSRDRLMREWAGEFPAYDFDRNKGYPCPRHRFALAGYGPSSIHRRSWSFMDDLGWGGVKRYVPPDPQGSLFDV